MPRTRTTPDAATTASDLHLVVGRIARALRQAHTVGDLTHSEASTLARLDRGGPASPGTLADEERVSPQAIATTLAGLETKRYVVRRPDPADGRRAIVSLTDLGAAIRRDRRTESARRLETGLATLEPGELVHLAEAIALLDRVAEAL